MKQMKNLSLLTQLHEDEEITVEDFVTFDGNLITSAGQINTNLIDWRQQARKEATKEVVPDRPRFDPSQAVNAVSDDDEDDQEENTPRHLTISEALQHLDNVLHFSMMENNIILTGLIAEVTISKIKSCLSENKVILKDCFWTFE